MPNRQEGERIMGNVFVVGIAGGSASGKTTIADQIQQYFGDQIEVIRHDSYYLPHNDMTYEERSQLNYDEPAAFDTSLMVYHLEELRRGHAIECPVYDFTIHNRSEQTIHIVPKKVIIVEGILIFADEELASEMDIKIFVDTDADERILRRILRDVRERGRTLESVVEQYLTTVKPMHEQYVEPSKRRADIIMLQGGHNLVALDMLIERIRSHIGQEI